MSCALSPLLRVPRVCPYLVGSLVPGQASADCQGTAGRAGIPAGRTNPPWSQATAAGERPQSRGDGTSTPPGSAGMLWGGGTPEQLQAPWCGHHHPCKLRPCRFVT